MQPGESCEVRNGKRTPPEEVQQERAIRSRLISRFAADVALLQRTTTENRKEAGTGKRPFVLHLTISSRYGNFKSVRIVSEKRIRQFIEREPRSAEAIWHLVDAIESASWRNPADLKATFASASFVGDLAIFNVGGNKYRIAAFVHYRKQIVYIKRIGRHEEYDQWDL